MPKIVILGAGTGGTLTANRLRRDARRRSGDRRRRPRRPPRLPARAAVRPVRAGRSRRHRPPRARASSTTGSSSDSETSTASRPPPTRSASPTARSCRYDVLVIATGARLLPEETEGLTGPGWRETVFDFYTLEGATALRDALARFDGGRLVVNPVDMPIKCPVAPLEFCFLADWYLRERGVRDAIELIYATPLDARVHEAGRRRASRRPAGREGHPARRPSSPRASVDGAERRLVSWDDREIPFDLLVTIPLHGGAEFVERSPGLGDELGFVADRPAHAAVERRAERVRDRRRDQPARPRRPARSPTSRARRWSPTSRHYLAGEPLEAAFDGHANCFIETGFHKALLIDFNYDVEPLPGRFPEPHLGRCRCSRSPASTTWRSCCSSGSTGTCCCPAAISPASAPRMRTKEGAPT